MSGHLNRTGSPRPRLHPELAASGVAGNWEWDLCGGVVYYDEGAAMLHTGDRSLAGKPLAGRAATVNVHPEDRGLMAPDVVLAAQTGGLFSYRYRVITPASDVRSLLSRGRVERGASGRAVRCRGVLIDVTESGTADAARARAMLHAAPADDLLAGVADRCLEARAAIERHGSAFLLRKVDALLFAVGQELAQTMTEIGRSRLH